MLSGNTATVSSNWFADVTVGQSSHAAAPSISASSVTGPASPAVSNSTGTTFDWIVQFNDSASGKFAGPADAAHLLPTSGAQFEIIEGLGAVGEVLVRSSGASAAQAAAALQFDANIAFSEPDSLKQMAADPNDPQYANEWAPADIGLPAAWNITTGSKNVVVAVVDSGVDYTDTDLAANIWTNPNAGRDGFSGDVHGYNFVSDTGSPMDDDGHGTHIAGIIGARWAIMARV